MTRRQQDFINYLTSHYDYIGKLDAVKIGVKDFGLTLIDAKRAFESLEVYS
jgi:hypothetical protein